MAQGGEFGIEQINVPASFKQRRLDFQIRCKRDGFKKADLQRSSHGFDPVMKKAMCHRRIEQRADHPTMQKSGVSLPLRIRLKEGKDGIPLRAEFHAKRVVLSADHT